MILLKNKIDKKKIAELPKVTFPGRIFVIYTEAEARKAVEYLNTRTIVGSSAIFFLSILFFNKIMVHPALRFILTHIQPFV